MTLRLTKRQASGQLILLFSMLAQVSANLYDLWEKIKLQGAKEGFVEKELADMARHYLKERQLSKDKIYYLFHRDEQKERVKRRKITTVAAKNVPLITTTIAKVGTKGNIIHFKDLSSVSNSVFLRAKEVEVLEFDLRQALDMGLRDALKNVEITKDRVSMVKIYANDGFVKKVEHRVNGSVRETSSA